LFEHLNNARNKDHPAHKLASSSDESINLVLRSLIQDARPSREVATFLIQEGILPGGMAPVKSAERDIAHYNRTAEENFSTQQHAFAASATASSSSSNYLPNNSHPARSKNSRPQMQEELPQTANNNVPTAETFRGALADHEQEEILRRLNAGRSAAGSTTSAKEQNTGRKEIRAAVNDYLKERAEKNGETFSQSQADELTDKMVRENVRPSTTHQIADHSSGRSMPGKSKKQQQEESYQRALEQAHDAKSGHNDEGNMEEPKIQMTKAEQNINHIEIQLASKDIHKIKEVLNAHSQNFVDAKPGESFIVKLKSDNAQYEIVVLFNPISKIYEVRCQDGSLNKAYLDSIKNYFNEDFPKRNYQLGTLQNQFKS
jgi:hypothetical protein